ncbi:MAG: 3-deoxy-D-manno-octulosonic acid transferase [Candidatus Aureabacteria bacterium]|nr:3-deoxy-D-manno-octulosonic acid transferase [Candidatus Auribacterota bacterium]
MIAIYNIIFHIGFLFMLPVFLFRMLYLNKYRAGLPQRFGFYPQEVRRKLRGDKTIWIHSVSVGEVIAAQPLIALLKSRYPESDFVVSTTTNTGNQVAQKYAGSNDTVIYYPIDFPWAVKRAVQAVNPKLFIMLETELWPNMIRTMGINNVPVFLVNGRVSDNSYGWYRKAVPVLKVVFKYISAFIMQAELDAERVTSLGASPEKVSYAGSLKYESAIGDEPEADEIMGMASDLGIQAGDTVIIGGSTHEREEEMLIKAFGKAKKECVSAKLILAPRHPERFSRVIALVKESGFVYSTRKKIREFNSEERKKREIIVLDTIGELKKVYNLGNIVFIGKSMFGRGGQNILEPAAAGKTIIAGPHMENFRDIMTQFINAKACVIVNNEIEFEEKLVSLCRDKAVSKEFGRRAKNLVVANCGAASRIADKITNM